MKNLLCAFALIASSAFAQSDASFAKANEAYAAGHFKEAISGYEALVQAGEWSANLFYDLGNAHFREGHFGNAILNYERALALQPRHPEAEANLRVARDEARALDLPQSRTERYLRFVTTNQYVIAAAAAFWLAAFGVAASIFSGRRSGGVIALSILSLSIFALAITAIYWIENQDKSRAVITGAEVNARVATADTANSVLALPPGSEVRIVSQRGDWVYAALPNNLRGWIPARSVESVRL